VVCKQTLFTLVSFSFISYFFAWSSSIILLLSVLFSETELIDDAVQWRNDDCRESHSFTRRSLASTSH